MAQPKKYAIIVACGEDGGIGLGGRIPWDIRADMARFRAVTSRVAEPSKRNAVIMGRATWESLPKALPRRLNVVISSAAVGGCGGAVVFRTMATALAYLEDQEDVETIFAIGGQGVYQEALQTTKFDRAYVTWITPSPHCDRFFPVSLLEQHFEALPDDGSFAAEGQWSMRFRQYQRRAAEHGDRPCE